MADTPITWGDLIKIVLFLLSAGVLFYLILAVANLVGILKNLNKMLAKNRASIDSTLEKLPAITDNVAKVSTIVKDEMENIQKVMGNIGKISDSAKDAAEMLKKDILVRARSLLEILDWLKKLFQDKGRRKKDIIYKYRYRPVKETVEEVVTGGEADDAASPQADKAESTAEGKSETVKNGEGI